MVVIVTCNEDDPVKNEGTRVLISLYVDFQTLKGSHHANKSV